jgi:hypothetical protein
MGWDGDGMGWGRDGMGTGQDWTGWDGIRHLFVVKTTCSAVALLPQTFFCWLYQKAHSAVALLPQALLLQKHILAKLGYA